MSNGSDKTLTERIFNTFMKVDKSIEKAIKPQDNCNIYSKSNNMDKLKELTHVLTSLPEMVKFEAPNRIDYNVENGISYAFNLMNRDNVAVANCFVSAGAEYKKHSHKEREFLVVYNGSLYAKICKGIECIESIVNDGDSIYFKEDEAHIIKALKDTWLVAITIPSAEGYPR